VVIYENLYYNEVCHIKAAIYNAINVDKMDDSEALVNKLVPCAWFLSGTLEVWRLRLRLGYCIEFQIFNYMCKLTSNLHINCEYCNRFI